MPVITVLNTKRQKQEKASHKHHNIREIGGFPLPRSLVFPKDDDKIDEGAKEYARISDQEIKKMTKERVGVTIWCRNIATVIIDAASKVFRRATRPKGNNVSEYATRPETKEENTMRNVIRMAMGIDRHEKKGQNQDNQQMMRNYGSYMQKDMRSYQHHQSMYT